MQIDVEDYTPSQMAIAVPENRDKCWQMLF